MLQNFFPVITSRPTESKHIKSIIKKTLKQGRNVYVGLKSGGNNSGEDKVASLGT